MTPMVARTDFPGPSQFSQRGGVIETKALQATFDPETLCIEISNIRQKPAHILTQVYPLQDQPRIKKTLQVLSDEITTPSQ